MLRMFRYFLLLTPLQLLQVATAATEGDVLFAEHDVLSVTLIAPLRAMSRDKDAEPEYRPGVFRFTDIDGTAKEVSLKVRPRGNSRRDRDVCAFPPLRLNFKKKEVKDTLFDNQNVLKLVTHCRRSEQFQQYVLKEYLVYRMFNLMSDASFRVRLLKVTYLDSERDSKPLERYGFLIEHKKRLAHRLNTQVVELNKIGYNSLEPRQASLAEVHQYLVSNTDFSFIAAVEGESCCHNAILLEGEDGTYLPIPYDFDRTGLVDPPNGEPAEELGQRNFRQRIYRGFCRDPQYIEAAIDKAAQLRPEFEALIAQQPDLSERMRDRADDFLESYYRVADDPEKRAVRMKCRGPLTPSQLTGD